MVGQGELCRPFGPGRGSTPVLARNLLSVCLLSNRFSPVWCICLGPSASVRPLCQLPRPLPSAIGGPSLDSWALSCPFQRFASLVGSLSGQVSGRIFVFSLQPAACSLLRIRLLAEFRCLCQEPLIRPLVLVLAGGTEPEPEPEPPACCFVVLVPSPTAGCKLTPYRLGEPYR